MKLITTFNKRQLRNAEHVQLHANVRAIITSVTNTKLGLNDEVFKVYTEAIAAEQDIVNQAAASIYTKEMEELNTKRSKLFSRIRGKLALCAIEDTASIAYKARNIVEQQLLSKYPASMVNKLAYQEKTAVITGFVLDCRTFLNSEQLESIRIDGDLDDILAINDKFNVSYQSRVAEKASVESELSLKLRAATDDAYTLITLCISAMANDPTEANAAKAAACANVVDLINVVLDDTRKRLEARLNRAGETADETPDDEGGATGSGSDTTGGNAGGDGGTTNNTNSTNEGGTSGSGTTTKPTNPGNNNVME